MTSFKDDLNKFSAKVEAKTQTLFVNVAGAAKFSITDGSAVTAAPGQLVDTGALKASWQLSFDSPTTALISTNMVYAPEMEYGVRNGNPLTQRSVVGGFHSLAMTAAGIQRIVDDEIKKMGDT